MAETEAPDATTNVVKVTEELDGDQIPTRNYRFSIIGEPVPIISDADFTFDMDSLPSRPLAVSERFGVIFVAHSSGFSVARMKDVIDAAEELKNGVDGSCIQELSVVDVSLGKVSILALSADSSMLAASVGLNLYFFSVDGLLNKDHEPLYSKSLDGSSYIKDMQWNPHLEDRYVVLIRDGSLYRGAGQGDLNHVMDNVDAVNWSMNGKFIAVAKHDFLSILSSKFEERLRIKLLFDSLVDDDPSCVVKVDSVRWVRPDCIILGCYCLSADGKEENHLLQFISVKDGKITDPSSSPVALNFHDAFLAINEDDIPSGSGPYTFVSYLDEFDLAFVANKKNTNQHIALFNWSEDGAAMIDIEVDSWVPTINLQVHNDDDNMILGLAINKDYKDEKTQLECGEIEKRVSPCCILMCVTVDGRFCMFHFASLSRLSLVSRGRDG
ncbi:putative transcription factor WD40-like family [Helianthus debilis subsp. tardiflorus]